MTLAELLDDLELILQSLIDAHPGPMYEHDGMCAVFFSPRGECNCSVARNLAAREAVKRLRAILEGHDQA